MSTFVDSTDRDGYSPSGKNRRLLVIDDNRSIHEDFRKILLPSNALAHAAEALEAALFGDAATVTAPQIQFIVDSAYQGQDGVQMVKAALEAGQPYAVAFVDVRMPPGLDGVETTQKIWEIDPTIQVVLCTAYSDYSWSEMHGKLGLHDGLLILKKPFDSVEALQLAHALTEKWWLHDQSRRKMEELEERVAERTRELQLNNQTLNRQKTELRVLFDFIPAMICFKDTKNVILRANRRMAEMVGKRVEEIEGKSLTEILPENAASYYEEDLAIIRSGEPRLGIIGSLRNHEGDEIVVQTEKVPVCDDRGAVVGIVVMAVDITERKRAEGALAETSALLESLLQNATDAIYFKDRHSRFVRGSRKILEIFNLTGDDELLGRTDFDFFSEAHARPAFEAEQEIIRTGQPVLNLEEEETYHDGRISRVLTSKMPWRDKSGQIIGTVGISRDVTERKQLEAQLFQSQKLETVGKLAGGIAHEFNSMLTAILGQCELLLSNLPSASPLVANATGIRKAAERAAKLTRQLLAYGRRQFLRPDALNLNQVVASMEGTLHHLVGHRIEIRVIPAQGLQPVLADAGQVEQVIVNLAMNSADAMPEGGTLTFETANVELDQDYASRIQDFKPGAYVMLTVMDTGTGMSVETQARVFEPFFTTKEVGQGTGLGLSTCYGIINQSGGHISVQSELGLGTTFKIFLPQFVAQVKTPSKFPVPLDLPGGKETILVVQENTTLREMTATVLGRLGYRVLAAANAAEALAFQAKRPIGTIDLLFVDAIMRDMNGDELAARMIAYSPSVRILFATDGSERPAGGAGIAVLQKPFTPGTLALKLREVLGKVVDT